MTKKKLIEDIKQAPARFYRAPCDVLRDRRFDDGERHDILTAWRGGAEGVLVADIDAAIGELNNRRLHAAE